MGECTVTVSIARSLLEDDFGCNSEDYQRQLLSKFLGLASARSRPTFRLLSLQLLRQ